MPGRERPSPGEQKVSCEQLETRGQKASQKMKPEPFIVKKRNEVKKERRKINNSKLKCRSKMVEETVDGTGSSAKLVE